MNDAETAGLWRREYNAGSRRFSDDTRWEMVVFNTWLGLSTDRKTLIKERGESLGTAKSFDNDGNDSAGFL